MPSQPRQSTSDAYAELEVESDFGGMMSYEWLRGLALLCFNPPDEDGAEEELVARAMVAAAEFIEAQPCRCEKTFRREPDAEPEYDEACDRCAVLGRLGDEVLSR